MTVYLLSSSLVAKEVILVRRLFFTRVLLFLIIIFIILTVLTLTDRFVHFFCVRLNRLLLLLASSEQTAKPVLTDRLWRARVLVWNVVVDIQLVFVKRHVRELLPTQSFPVVYGLQLLARLHS